MIANPVLLWEAGACSFCALGDLVCIGVAVRVGGAERFNACPRCLELVRVGELLPETRRVLAIGADWKMMQVLKPGQTPDNPPERLEGAARDLVFELAKMIEADPNKGTELEEAFFNATRARTREIGAELYRLGGHEFMIAAYNAIRAAYGHSARSLEVAWNGVGEWFD